MDNRVRMHLLRSDFGESRARVGKLHDYTRAAPELSAVWTASNSSAWSRRNVRTAAIHSLFRFAALAHPEHAESIARVLAIPPNSRRMVTVLGCQVAVGGDGVVAGVALAGQPVGEERL